MLVELINSYNKYGYIYEYFLNERGKSELEYQHRRIWKDKYGNIPDGYSIHHINKLRNYNKLGKLYIFLLFGEVVYLSGNLLCLPNYLHTKLFHSIEFNKK
jgi:hypothetical protein